jgi:ClpP class serine protease
MACADFSVKSIDYLVNSPGGNWDGADKAAEAVKTAEKPTRAIVGATAASAAYLLASQAGKIFAETKGSMVGSIGVAAEYYDRTLENEKKGIRRIVFTNSESGDKRPALETDEGGAIFTEQLDAMYKVMEDRIVEGRGNAGLFMTDNIRGLKGRMVTAQKAQDLGLIDGILSEMKEKPSEKNNSAAGAPKGVFMDGEDERIAAEQKAAGEKLAAERLTAAVSSERERVMEIIRLSGLKMSAEAKEAIMGGADAGTFAKARLETLNGAGANAEALGNPKPLTNNLAALSEKSGNAEAGVTLEDVKNIAKGVR